MVSLTVKQLFAKLHPVPKKALEAALGLCMSRTNYNVEIEHWLLKLSEVSDSDMAKLFREYGVDLSHLTRDLTRALDRLKTGNARPPALSEDLNVWVREAFLLGSVEKAQPRVRSGHMLAALLLDQNLSSRAKSASSEFDKIPATRILADLDRLAGDSVEAEPLPGDNEAIGATAAASGQPGMVAHGSKTPALDQFTVDLTARARAGKIDPVIGRESEVQQVIDILSRRRQNNPLIVGEAGVGKTAVVEGFALRVVSGDVPEPLRKVAVRTLDIGLLQAGAGVRGEFENRLKSVIAEVQSSPTPVILFIDEAHTLMGGSSGQSEAANLLKPALARGELRTIAATTFAEYKKSFEDDPAMKRRFQPVTVDEPSVEKCVAMLRGLSKQLEEHHRVRILEEAMEEAVRLSSRYITDRQLPDKAISVLDTACSRVGLSQSSTPPALEDCRREIERIDLEMAIREREAAALGLDHRQMLIDLSAKKKALTEKLAQLEKRWEEEKKLVDEVRARVEKLEAHLHSNNTTKKDAKAPATTPLTDADVRSLREEIDGLFAKLREVQGESPLVLPVVNAQAVAEVVARWTGVPMGKMVRNEIEMVMSLADRLKERVVGQDHALEIIAKRIQTARAGLTDPTKPVGVFLLAGTSGVGKTETAVSLADLMFGGDRGLVVINMSEYKEEHKISRLTGSAAGYVGFGQGGVLTEAIRRKPNCVLLLDEIEKAHPSFYEVFMQVFDKGVITDDKGQAINFKNTIILLTSNVGTDTIMRVTGKATRKVEIPQLQEALKPDLFKVFPPAFVGRVEVVPYYPLPDEILRKIVKLKLNKVGARIKDNYKATLEVDDSVIETLLSRCKEVDIGARVIDQLINNSLLPEMSSLFLARMSEQRPVEHVKIGMKEDGGFDCQLLP